MTTRRPLGEDLHYYSFEWIFRDDQNHLYYSIHHAYSLDHAYYYYYLHNHLPILPLIRSDLFLLYPLFTMYPRE